MRVTMLSLSCAAILGLCAYLGARPQPDTVKVRLRLTDAATGVGVGGIVRVFQEDGKPLVLPGLFDRLRGLERSKEKVGWYVVPRDGAATTLPRGKLRLEAVSGLETARAQQELDLSKATPEQVTVKLDFLFRPGKDNLVAGNTHLHLRGISKEDSDDYLRQVPAADGLQVLFISYLERHKDDLHYITNRYPVGNLEQFSATGVLFNNGEEHRHNFEGFGQGYGHVMFLGIKELVQPVSLGPGITGAGFDDRVLRPGIDEARQQGGTIIWCHNTNGHEDVPSALTGRLDALNVFDGGRIGRYEDGWYHYLNIGLRLPLSTGTDWFLYDFARVYAKVPGALTIPSWLNALKAGRCVATNGPLLDLTVDGRPLGDTLKLDKPRTVRIEAKAQGRHDFQKLELIHNGKMIHSQAAKSEGRGFAAHLNREVHVEGSGWFAVRADAPTRNELDRPLYAHTSPVYLTVGGQPHRDREAAQALLRQLEEGQADIQARGKFSTPAARAKVLALHDEAKQMLRERMKRR